MVGGPPFAARASAVYLTASVVPQARRAIRRRRVVFRREVPSNTHRVASQHRTLVALAGCTTVEGAVCQFRDLASLTCRSTSQPTQAAHHVPRLACVGGPSLTPWPGRNADDERESAGGPYRSCLFGSPAALSLACASRRQQQSQRCRTSHTLRSPDPDLTPDV